MTDPSDLDGAIAVQVNAIVGAAMFETTKWWLRQHIGIEYVPPLFRLPGVEFPVVPRIAPPSIEGAGRRSMRR